MTEGSRIDVRGVSGWGPYCGCGKPSALHVTEYERGELIIDIFLCASCTSIATLWHLRDNVQPSYLGDRDRDAPPEPQEVVLAQASPAFEGKGKDDPGLSGGCVTGRDVGDEPNGD